jgi:hypothetical protein
MAWVEKVIVGKTPENLTNRTNKMSIKEREIFWVAFLFCQINCAVTFVPLNEA